MSDYADLGFFQANFRPHTTRKCPLIWNTGRFAQIDLWHNFCTILFENILTNKNKQL